MKQEKLKHRKQQDTVNVIIFIISMIILILLTLSFSLYFYLNFDPKKCSEIKFTLDTTDSSYANFIGLLFNVMDQHGKIHCYLDKNNNTFYSDIECTEEINEDIKFISHNYIQVYNGNKMNVDALLRDNGQIVYCPSGYRILFENIEWKNKDDITITLNSNYDVFVEKFFFASDCVYIDKNNNQFYLDVECKEETSKDIKFSSWKIVILDIYGSIKYAYLTDDKKICYSPQYNQLNLE